MSNLHNDDFKDPFNTGAGNSKQDRIDKLNSAIKDMQRSVDELQRELDNESGSAIAESSLKASQGKSDKAPGIGDDKQVVQSPQTELSSDAESTMQPVTKPVQSTDDSKSEVASKIDLSKSDPTSAEYVTPVYPVKHRKKRRHNNRNEDKNRVIPKKLDSSDDDAIDDYVYATPHKKKKKRKSKKQKALQVIGIILGVIIGLVIVALSTVFIMNQVGKSQMHNYDDINIQPPPDTKDIIVEDNGLTIKYKNHTYSFNKNIATCVLLGIDEDHMTEIEDTGINTDAIYIAVINTTDKKVTLLGVSRDTIVDVNIYDRQGRFIDTTPMQICLSYAYGDGGHTSCENTMRSLERLFYGLPFETYFALNFDAMQTLNDLVGGVQLKSSITFQGRNGGRTINAGETVTLAADEARQYIQQRDVTQLGSNANRMERQKQYMTAFMSQIIPSAKKDLSVITDMYSCVSDNSTTNLTVPKITYLASTALSGLSSYKDVKFANVPGTIVQGEKYAEFHVDEDAFMQQILDLFYVKIN